MDQKIEVKNVYSCDRYTCPGSVENLQIADCPDRKVKLTTSLNLCSKAVVFIL